MLACVSQSSVVRDSLTIIVHTFHTQTYISLLIGYGVKLKVSFSKTFFHLRNSYFSCGDMSC